MGDQCSIDDVLKESVSREPPDGIVVRVLLIELIDQRSMVGAGIFVAAILDHLVSRRMHVRDGETGKNAVDERQFLSFVLR